MSTNFSRILEGLMQNRKITARLVSRASGRAESTINQLLNGSLAPTPQIIGDIAPVLQLEVGDLLVIANLSPDSSPSPEEPYPATKEIGRLVAAASRLYPDQVISLIESAKAFREHSQ